MENVRFYYDKLYKIATRYRYALTLSRLCKLCKRSASSVDLALRFLPNSVVMDEEEQPPLVYERVSVRRNRSHRAYRIWLRELREKGC